MFQDMNVHTGVQEDMGSLLVSNSWTKLQILPTGNRDTGQFRKRPYIKFAGAGDHLGTSQHKCQQRVSDMSR